VVSKESRDSWVTDGLGRQLYVDQDLKKVPAISETIDWARTLLLLHADTLDPQMVRDTLNVILKFQEDIENVDSEITTLTSKALK